MTYRAGAESLEMVAPTGLGRRFGVQRRVRLGDASPDGRLRLDAAARYLQDIANDDARDAGAEGRGLHGWVVRRTVIDVHRAARYLDELVLATWIAGIGAGWVDRRTQITSGAAVCIEASSLWVHVDPRTMRPQRLTPDLLRLWDGASGGRRIRATTVLPPETASSSAPGGVHPWHARRSDFDGFGHMNNAAYWEIVEEHRHRTADGDAVPVRCVVEHLDGILPGESVDVRILREDDDTAIAVVADGVVKAMCWVGPLSRSAG